METMPKEEILESLQSLVRTLMDQTERLREDKAFRETWQQQQQLIGNEVKKLNSCDAVWLNDEYGRWFNTEIKPNVKDIPPELEGRLLWK